MSKQKEAKHKYIFCDVYKRGVSIFIGSCSDLYKWASSYYVDEQSGALLEAIRESCSDDEYKRGDIAARIYYDNCGSSCIHLQSFPDSLEDVPTLAHEVLHATFIMLDFVGVAYSIEGANEAFAYLFEHILRNALDPKGYEKIK